MKYRQINAPFCEAVQWFKTGGHPAVTLRILDGPATCEKCGAQAQEHGFISNEGRTDYTVCPGDWVLFTDFYYPMSAADFVANYAPVVSGDEAADLRESQAEIEQALANLRLRGRGRATVLQERGAVLYKLREALHWMGDALVALHGANGGGA